MKKIALLGSTGSIGKQVIEVVKNNHESYQIFSLSAGYNAELFLNQINLLRPKIATFAGELSDEQKNRIPTGVKCYFGEEAYLESIVSEVDLVFVALVGFVGLKAVLKSTDLKKDIALANKESLVVGGELVLNAVKESGVNLIPVDSEHSAIWQGLNFDLKKPFRKLIITASGGAFRNLSVSELESVTAQDALKHPNWNMGKKITIDCATMMNKGFEVIEAMRLFNADLSQVEVVIHPESIIHSMVEFCDGAVMAEMSYPTMEIPIALALSYPKRLENKVKSVDFVALGSLNFAPVDTNKYPCFALALDAVKKGDNYPCALNASNEVAVKAFLEGKIKFTDIANTVSYTLSKTNRVKIERAETLYEEHERATAIAKQFIGALNV